MRKCRHCEKDAVLIVDDVWPRIRACKEHVDEEWAGYARVHDWLNERYA